MNEHEATREQMALAAAGVLSPSEWAAFTCHLGGCALCTEEFDSWCTLITSIKESPLPEVSAGLAARTCSMIAGEAARRPESGWNEAMAAVLCLYAWTVSAIVWIIWRVLEGGALSLVDAGFQNAFLWLSATTVFGWLTAGLTAVLIGHRRVVGRMI